MKRIFLTLSFLAYLFSAAAQDPDSVVVEYPYPEYYEDTTAASVADEPYTAPQYHGEDVPLNKFDQENWKKIVGNRNYEEEPEKAREKEKEKEKKSSNESNDTIEIKPWDSGLLKVVAFIFVAAVIGAVIYNLTKNLGGQGAIKINRSDLGETSTEIENIEDVDLRSPLAKALAEGNLKLAVRLYYLNLLKALNEGGMIRWKKDKTNREYLSELYLANYFYSEIRGLTLSYEEVWYGEHPLPAESLREIIREFETINQQVTPAAR